MNTQVASKLFQSLGLIAASTLALGCVAELEDGQVDDTEASDLAPDQDHDVVTKDITWQGNDGLALIVEVWEHPNFRGGKRMIVRDERTLHIPEGCETSQDFNDTISSVRVWPGPGYQRWKDSHGNREPHVTLWQHAGNTGLPLTLQRGTYPDLARFGRNDMTSAVQFARDDLNVQLPAALLPTTTFAIVPVILHLHNKVRSRDCREEPDYTLTIVESVRDIDATYGGRFNDSISWIEAVRGPNFGDGSGSYRVWPDDHFSGADPRLFRHAESPQLELLGWDDRISSIQLFR